MTQAGVRNLAFTIGLFIYATLDTLITADFISRHISSSHPDLLNAALIAARSVQLAATILLVEKVALRWWARRILGVWAYYSASGNFGLAEIRLVNGELNYRVQLYRSAENNRRT